MIVKAKCSNCGRELEEMSAVLEVLRASGSGPLCISCDPSADAPLPVRLTKKGRDYLEGQSAKG